MQNFNLIMQLFQEDIELMTRLNGLPEEKKIELDEKFQDVIMETALGLMTEEQYQAFKVAVRDENDPVQIEQKVTYLAHNIEGLGNALKQALSFELSQL